MDFHYAKKQFKENVELFGDPQSNPEKYNLYNGLANLADGLENLEQQLAYIRAMLESLRKGR